MEIRNFNSYEKMQETHQKEFNELPKFCVVAFDNENFLKKMKEEIKKNEPNIEINTIEDIQKHVFEIGCSVFMLRKNKRLLDEWYDRAEKEKLEFEKNQDNLIQMIVYEMINVEYGYTHNNDDVLEAIGKENKDMGNPNFKEAWNKAKKIYFEKHNNCF